ncbi:MAG TPA: hypothetical protein PKV75_06415 [Desulfobacterales bacterium]|nr:hypothetical protein [Desulfobacterales bacterium]
MSKKSIRDELENSKLRLEILKENYEYQDFFKKFLAWYEQDREKDVWPVLGFKIFGLGRLRYYIGHPYFKISDIIDLLNPEKNTDEFFIKPVCDVLPKLFYDNAVSLVECDKKSITEVPIPGSLGPLRTIEELNSSQRLYIIDFSKKRKQIEIEFKKYVDAVFASGNLKEDTSRQRKENSLQLEVWKKRRQKIDFREISKSLKISIDTAKNHFYRAYELIQGKKYDKDHFKKLMRVKKSDMKNLCEKCPQRKGCMDLCPEALRYVNQDYVKIDYHEKLL